MKLDVPDDRDVTIHIKSKHSTEKETLSSDIDDKKNRLGHFKLLAMIIYIYNSLIRLISTN